MNVCNLSGQLSRNATFNDADRTLAFTLATRFGFDAETGKERVAFVPCVMCRPPRELVEQLTDKGKGLTVELEGRVANSRYEIDGQPHHRTEVIVRHGTFAIVKGQTRREP